ncbi:P-loop containing nucleoside triphosphate hydrolase protein [Cladochytrium replicatum]|nr:P-loop containing nucleoside triphosphate hydrolase protein [Cladochytrium replicatum]
MAKRKRDDRQPAVVKATLKEKSNAGKTAAASGPPRKAARTEHGLKAFDPLSLKTIDKNKADVMDLDGADAAAQLAKGFVIDPDFLFDNDGVSFSRNGAPINEEDDAGVEEVEDGGNSDSAGEDDAQEAATAISDDEDDDEDDAEAAQRKADYFDSETVVPENSIESFTDIRLSRPILRAISEMGYVKPTKIQSRSIPIALQGRDICGAANNPATRVLVLLPTRELAVQCHEVAVALAKYTDIMVSVIVGGMPLKVQEAELKKRPDVVIATPGRLIDHVRNSPSFGLDGIEILIIDEADRILEDGFAAELKEIVSYCPKGRQSMLFSATMTDNVDDLIRVSLDRPVKIFVDRTKSIASKLVQEFVRVRANHLESKPALLAALCSIACRTRVIVFFATKAAAHRMKVTFTLLGLKAAELHGDLSQQQRLEAMEHFKTQKANFLLATDLAARGLDITGIKTVINYDMPKMYSQYVHRVGRTARANLMGRSISLVTEADRKIMKMAIKNAKEPVKHRIIPPEIITKYQDKVNELTDRLAEVLKYEKEEKAIQKAEMEVQKAENILTHRDEIMSRPARTFIDKEKDKKAKYAESKTVEQAVSAYSFQALSCFPLSPAKPKRDKHSGLSRKQKRRKLMEEDAGQMKMQKLSARSAKKASRPKRISHNKK